MNASRANDALTQRRNIPVPSALVTQTKRRRWMRRRRLFFRYGIPDLLARAGINGPLPGYLIIGTQRGGTTYLHDMLLDHPSVTRPLVKEVHYFERLYYRGSDWYRANFALGHMAARRVPASQRIVGEATADYLFSPCVPQRVHDLIPNVKLIALLRNPVDRAYSHYQLSVRIGVEQLPFEEAIEAETGRLGWTPEEPWQDEIQPTQHQVAYSYRSKGLYAQQLRRWLARFSSEQILLINSERLYTHTPEVLAEVAQFLDLPPWQPRGQKNTNSIQYSSMHPDTRRQLVEFFRPHNQELYKLIGARFDWDADPMADLRQDTQLAIPTMNTSLD